MAGWVGLWEGASPLLLPPSFFPIKFCFSFSFAVFCSALGGTATSKRTKLKAKLKLRKEGRTNRK